MEFTALHILIMAMLVFISLFITKIKKKVEENSSILEHLENKYKKKTLK